MLASFDNTDGTNPSGSLTLSADGSTLYGTTEAGGTNNDGTVFAISVPVPEPAAVVLFFTGFFLMPSRLRRNRVEGRGQSTKSGHAHESIDFDRKR